MRSLPTITASMAIKILLKAVLIAIVLFVSIVVWSSPSYALLYSKTGMPLKKGDFEINLDKKFIRSTDPLFLEGNSSSKAAFSEKWKTSLEDGSVQFFRSYPSAYHHDLAQIPTNKIPGEAGLCFGDAHPENFGFVNLDERTIFGYNDLDDSGYCPIAYDALRFFTALRLWFDDLTQDTLEKYVDVAKDPTQASPISRSLSPNCYKEPIEELNKHTNEKQFKHSKNLQRIAPTDSRYIGIKSIVDKRLANYDVLDIASRTKEEGGSTGLTRYWVLVKTASSKPSILELKEAPNPGVEYGRRVQVLSMDNRLSALKKRFWKDDSNNDNFYVTVSGTRFLVRNRLNIKGIKINKHCEGDDLKKLLQAEVSYMATVHSEHWSSVKKDDLRTWLWDSSKALSERWKAVYEKPMS